MKNWIKREAPAMAAGIALGAVSTWAILGATLWAYKSEYNWLAFALLTHTAYLAYKAGDFGYDYVKENQK